MLAVFAAALIAQSGIGKPQEYLLPESTLKTEPLYEKCLQRHPGATKKKKCGCIVTYLMTKHGDWPTNWNKVNAAFDLLFQYDKLMQWEIETRYGFSGETAVATNELRWGADNMCKFSPAAPNGPLRD